MKRPKTVAGLLAELGFMAGSGITLIANPGNITVDEGSVLVQDWIEVLNAKRAFEDKAGQIEFLRRERPDDSMEEVFKLWVQLRDLWERLDFGLDSFARDFHDAYHFDRVETGSLEPPVSGNIVVQMVQDARRGFVPGSSDRLIVQLPAGDLPAFVLGVRDRRDEVDCSFLEETTLILQGHPDGTAIQPQHNLRGWGCTIAINSAGRWAGRVHLVGLTIYASGGNALASHSPFGDRNARTPYKDIRLAACRFLDHPDPLVDCIRPVSVNHAALSVTDCFVDMPHSREHWIYSRNPFNADTVILRNHVIAIGGQIMQYVSRPGEGPSYGPSLVTVSENDFRGYHRYCERAATAITVAGSGQDWRIEGNVIADLVDGGCFKQNASGGAIVVWNGGTFWEFGKASGIDGARPVELDQVPPSDVRANGRVVIANNYLRQPNPDRATIALEDAVRVDVISNGILGRECSINMARVSEVFWSRNNLDEVVEEMVRLGLAESGSGRNAEVRRADRTPTGWRLMDTFSIGI